MTTLTLCWMNKIREARSAHVSDKEIVDALFRVGLAEEKRIEQSYKDSAIEAKKQRVQIFDSWKEALKE